MKAAKRHKKRETISVSSLLLLVFLFRSAGADSEVQFLHSFHLVTDPLQGTDAAVGWDALVGMPSRIVVRVFVISFAFFAVSFMPE